MSIQDVLVGVDLSRLHQHDAAPWTALEIIVLSSRGHFMPVRCNPEDN